MHVCMYVCMYVWMDVCMHACYHILQNIIKDGIAKLCYGIILRNHITESDYGSIVRDIEELCD